MTQTYDSEWTPGPTAIERMCPGMSVETIEYGYTDPLVDGSNPQTSADVGFVLPYVTSQTYSGTLSETIGYRYDDFFRLDAIRYAGETVELTYDEDGLLVGAGGFTLAYKGDNGLPLSVSDGMYTFTPVYNGFGEAISAAYDINSGTGAFAVAVERDDTGQIMAKTETLDEDATEYAYAYYANGRLFTVERDSETVEEYQYDGNGNRVHDERGASERWFTYGPGDALTGVYSDAAKTSLLAGYTYDANGYLATKTQPGVGVTAYDYSATGELRSVTLPSSTVIQYIYDPLGRRIAKKVNGAPAAKYLWAGRVQLLAVYDGSDNLAYRFEYAGGRLPVAVVDGSSNRHYLAYDQVGSLRAVFDDSGTLEESIEYDSFGNVLSVTGTLLGLPLGYAGGLYDSHTGLTLFGYRDYDPAVGRWLAKDPIGLGGGDSNLYAYCGGDPVNVTDSLGLWGWDGDWIQGGVGGLLGCYGSTAAASGWIETDKGLAAGIDGFIPIPFLNPLQSYYANKDGSIDTCYELSRLSGQISSLALAGAAALYVGAGVAAEAGLGEVSAWTQFTLGRAGINAISGIGLDELFGFGSTNLARNLFASAPKILGGASALDILSNLNDLFNGAPVIPKIETPNIKFGK